VNSSNRHRCVAETKTVIQRFVRSINIQGQSQFYGSSAPLSTSEHSLATLEWLRALMRKHNQPMGIP